jgi:hypothetical protein
VEIALQRAMRSLVSGVRATAPFGAALWVTFFLFAVPAMAARLGGAYYVDDAEIGKSGSCEIETWSSFAKTGDRIAVFSPACVVDVGRPVEIGTNLVDLRSDGQEDVLATLTAKTVPIPIGRSGFGLAIAGAIVYDPLNQTGSGLIVNVPLTFDQQRLPGQCEFRRPVLQRGRSPRVVRYRRRRRLLDFRTALERYLGGVCSHGAWANEPSLSEWTAI